ncbi:5'-3' exoribonuclease 2-like [Rhopilema esculentum]|uniref:5'-3' exoribonuclease 2-like n=1 Tax=Rhopilema esculentum TaxID=499914 RepID=UPI0031D53F4E
MGVPAFFRWLSRKYPSIVVHAVEQKPVDVDGNKVYVDTTKANPNDVEFDNLYLDMNGIIHPCCHPENKPAPKNEDEMMVAIFEYIDRLFAIVRPRKLLYMAIDGVAPRAKMNQQRSRRFRAAKDSRESKDEMARIREDLRQNGALLPPEKEKGEHFDSNCITPGTQFMDRLSKCLQYYISDRLNNDPGWKGIKVILSDANSPGEGEHKIMDYIRKQRGQPDHDPNTKHCLNGADADLIMLGLATHEPNFTIIREEFKPGKPRPCTLCGQIGHDLAECKGLPKEKAGEFDELTKPVGEEVEFIFIRLNVLREYLERDLRMDGLAFKYDFERSLDDWVFMCFFVGNDFLPHLPSLEIREGAIDRLIRIYKGVMARAGGYLTENGYVSLERVQQILQELGQAEDQIFKTRQEKELNFRRRKKDQDRANKRAKMGHDLSDLTPLMNKSPNWSPRDSPRQFGQPHRSSPGYSTNQRAASDLRSMLRTPETNERSAAPSPVSTTPISRMNRKRPNEQEEANEEEDEEPADDVRLWEDGWRERYYLQKFGVSTELSGYKTYEEFRKEVGWAYVRGLCWVLQYYYQGCPSWKWYFPYHYAPFASDFVDIVDANVTFEKGTGPFKPLEQLMSVFPAASGNFLPPTWRELMSGPESPIIDFYPEDFKIDLNGKKYAWQGVALLPFVDEKRLLSTLKSVYGDLTEEEVRRNRRDINLLFCGSKNSLFDYLVGLYEGGMLKEKQEIVTKFSQGMKGTVMSNPDVVMPKGSLESPVPGLQGLKNQMAISVKFEDPKYDEDFVYPATLLPNAVIPGKVLKPEDFPSNRRYTPQTGFSPRSHNPYHISPGGRRMIGYNQDSPQRFNSPDQSRSPRMARPQSQGYRSPYGNYNSPDRTPSPLARQPSPFYRPGGNMPQRQPSPYNRQDGAGSSPRFQGRRSFGGGGYQGSDNRGYADNRGGWNQQSFDNQRDDRSRQDPRRHSFPMNQNRFRPY